jgi:hypothetical protein
MSLHLWLPCKQLLRRRIESDPATHNNPVTLPALLCLAASAARTARRCPTHGPMACACGVWHARPDPARLDTAAPLRLGGNDGYEERPSKTTCHAGTQDLTPYWPHPRFSHGCRDADPGADRPCLQRSRSFRYARTDDLAAAAVSDQPQDRRMGDYRVIDHAQDRALLVLVAHRFRASSSSTCWTTRPSGWASLRPDHR